MDYWVSLETLFPFSAQCLVLSGTCYASRSFVVDFPVVVQRPFPMVQTVCRTKEVPLLLDGVIDVPVVQVVQLLRWWSRRAQNCGFPQLQFSDTLMTCPLLSLTGLRGAADEVLAVMDVSVIMQRRYSSSRRLRTLPLRNRDGYAQCSCAWRPFFGRHGGGDEG